MTGDKSLVFWAGRAQNRSLYGLHLMVVGSVQAKGISLVYRSSSSVQFVQKDAEFKHFVLFGSRKKLNSQICYFYAKTTRCFTHLHPSPQTFPLCPSLHISTLPNPSQSPLLPPNLLDLPLLYIDLFRRLCCFRIKVADLGI